MIKRIVACLLSIVVLISIPICAVSEEAVFTERKGKGVERFLWDELSQHSPSDVVTAAVLSYFWRESQYRSDAVAGWAISYHGYWIDLCDKVTSRTDKGLDDGSSREYFLKACRKYGGYGLGQWRRTSYIEGLYDFAVEYGTSIGDARMQCAFVFKSLQEDEELWSRLKRCDDPKKAGRLVAIYYDGSQSGAEYMGYKAGRFYNKYHEEGK